MKTNDLKCTWCNGEIRKADLAIVDKGDPFCSQLCLDLQLHDDSLFEKEHEKANEVIAK